MELEAVFELFDKLNDALLVVAKGSIIEYANSAASKLFNHTKEDLIGLPCTALYESEVNLDNETLRKGIPISSKARIKKDFSKNRHELEIAYSMLETSEGVKLVEIIQPVSEELFSWRTDEIIRSIKILTLPVVLTAKKGNILFVNPAFEKLTGFTFKDLNNTKITTILQPYNDKEENESITFISDIKKIDNKLFIIKTKNNKQNIFLAHISNPDSNEPLFIWLFENATDKEDTREEIKQREGYLKSIFRAAPVGIGVTINRIFDFVNHRICEITGYSSNELLGKSARILYPDEEEYQRVGTIKYKQIYEEGTGTIETIWKCKDGQLKDILLSSTPVDQNDLDKGVTFTALDITRRKEAEKRSRNSEKKYRNLIETAADAIFVADAQTGRLVEANKQACELIGRSEKEIIGMHQFELHPKDRAEKTAKEFRDVTETKRTIVQTEVLHKSGKRIPVEINPTYYTDEEGQNLIIGFFRDLSSRMEWQRALQESELKFEALFETAKEGIVLVNQETTKFEYVNPAMCEFLGFSKEELLKRGTVDIHDEKQYKSIQQKIQRVLQGEQHAAMDIPCLTKIGKQVYADVQATYIYIKGVKYTAAFFNNITRRREVEQKLRTINKELKISQKKYQRLFDELVSGFAVHRMIYDDNGVPVNYQFIEINPAFEKLTGFKADQILNKTVKELMPGIEDAWIKKYAEVAKTGKPMIFQQYVAPLKKYYEVTAYSPEKDFFATIFTDVTSLVETTRNLALSEERYRELVENSPNVLVVFSENKFLYANPFALNLLGYESMDELKHLDPFSYVHPNYRRIAKKRLKELKPGVKNDPIQLKLVTRTGEEKTIDSLSLAINYNNKPASLLIGRDITNKMRIEQVARRTQTAIENIQKGIASKVGKKFFETIVTQLARTLKADFAFIGELVSENLRYIETISVIEKGKIIPNLSYELLDTPCEKALKQGLLSIREGVTRLFPKDQMLIDMNIQGYVGVPLHNSKGMNVGIMVALFKQPIEDLKFANTILEIFSVRAGAEIERRKSEEDLERANILFRTITQNIPDIILRVDRNFRCIYVSPHVYQLADIQAEEFIGKRISDFDLRTDFTENREKEFDRVLKSKESYQTVLNVKTAQNRKILEWRMVPEFDEHGEVLSILNIIRDITELRRTENELNQIFNLSADLICILNSDGKFLKVNPAFENILGHSEQEILATKIFNLIHPDDIELTTTTLQEKMGPGERIVNFENRIRCKDGSYKWISWVIQSLGDEDLVYAIARDITNQKKTIKELVTAKEKAEESDRLKSAFLANMSHEIRTPMNAIIGFAMLLQRQGLNPEKILHYTTIIRHRSEDLLHIINDILDISKIELEQITILKEEFSINDVFNELFDEFTEKLKLKTGKSIAFSIENYAEAKYQKVTNDKLRFKQVLTNLIDNAIKFTFSGHIKFGCKPDGKTFTFYVTDTGIGIPMHKQKDVFERFRQVDESITREYGGNGLGLAISKALVELMGGKIWLESREAVGTTFYFTIPLDEGIMETTTAPEIRKNKTYNLSGKRILIVEDDPLSIEFFRIVLEDAKAEVTIASSGGEALIIYESDPAFDIILMDVQLPDINGYEVTRRIRQTNRTIPIIAQTAFAMAEDRTKSFEAGCNEYLSKPILSDELLEVISNQIQLAGTLPRS